MTTSTLLATWLHKSTIVGTSAFYSRLRLPRNGLSRNGAASMLVSQPLYVAKLECTASFVSLFSSLEISELTNIGEYFLILLIMFAQNSHCITQL